MNSASTSNAKQSFFEDDEIFDDSTFLANFDNMSFKQKNVENYVINSANNSTLNVSALCCDEEISGYDKLSGETWIYPTNYPVRDYQFNIIRAAILKNTLVSLPTGLGKTFIAAVIMYNFYRWYPLGKIVFTAPTRPLVAQQIDACYNIIAIPPDDTIEMTGHMQVNTRKTHWQTKRVFFATPQVIYNDIKSGICPANKIRCLVMDEAHRARGNYAYCQIVATLDEMGCRTYRMLALSATPGSKVDDVVSVVKSLHIAHLELRTENCIDVAPYSHSRRINTVIVQLGPELTQLRQQYIEILDFYARRLKQFNILPHNLGNLSKGRIVMLYKEYQTKDRGARHPQHNYIMKDFTLLIALYHGLELLMRHGSRVFLNFFDEHPEKSWIQSDDRLTAMLERLRDDLGVNPLSLDRSILPDGTVPEIPKDLCFGHPKFDKLKDIMLEHFHTAKRNNQDTRAIVFCEYRESVNLVHCLLLQCRPLIVPQMFVGQGASGKDGKTVISQKQQLRVMRSFREGACNTLVATCVAEEGLDIGSVDLILCFDISTRSPVRLVQRCGRTGRERGGQVYILVTEGKEHQTLVECMRQRDGLNKRVLQSKEIENNLYKLNPRMMPHGHTPECRKMYITVAKKDEKESTNKTYNKKGQKDLRSMLLSKTSSSSSSSSKSNRQSNEFDSDVLITDAEFREVYPDGYRERNLFSKPVQYWTMSKEKLKAHIKEPINQDQLNLSTWLEWQRTLQNTVNVEHSKDTIILTDILQKCDEKRLEPTQRAFSPVFNQPLSLTSQKSIPSPIKTTPIKTKQTIKKKQKITAKSPAKNNGDIRSLFCTASTKSYTKLVNDLGIPTDGSVSTRMINLLVDLNIDNNNINKSCYICDHFCDCKVFKKTSETNKAVLLKFLKDPIYPNLDLIDDIDSDAINKCVKGIESQGFPNCDVEIDKSIEKVNSTNNFDLEFDFDALDDIDSPKHVIETETVKSSENNFDLGNIEDIFASSSPEEVIEKEKHEELRDTEQPKETLEFFGLDSIEDIFADSDDSVVEAPLTKTLEPKTPKKNELDNFKNDPLIKPVNMENPVSPSILSGVLKPTEIPKSPILCSQVRKLDSNVKKSSPFSSTPNCSARKKLKLTESENNNVVLLSDDEDSKTTNCVTNTTNKSMFTITQLVDMINKNDKSVVKDSSVDNSKNRSGSPILMSQTDRKKTTTNLNISKNTSLTKAESLIILDSDSESDDTQIYELDKDLEFSQINSNVSKKDTNQVDLNVNNKRKFDDTEAPINASPYFNKKPKLDHKTEKPLTIQQKVLAAITSNKNKTTNFTNNQTNYHCTVSPFLSQKENKNPQVQEKLNKSNDDIKSSPIEKLQEFRKKNMVLTLRNKFNSIFKRSPEKSPQKPKRDDLTEIDSNNKILTPNFEENIKICHDESSLKRQIQFDSSDDDFVSDRSTSPKKNDFKINTHRSTTNHKVRKKRRKHNSLIELEASLSDDGSDSGDELSDDSAGSILQFICDDDDVTHNARDIHAVYLKSVRSPVKKHGFKIPELPTKYNKADVFSQFVAEDDAYEMDSFCVDSHIGLTQANEVSELEVAEMILEKKRRRKKAKFRSPSPNENNITNGDSPIIRRMNKNSNRIIDSDSDDSS